MDLTIGLMNDEAQVKELLSYYNFAIAEECFFEGNSCYEKYVPFANAGKPVFIVEYTL